MNFWIPSFTTPTGPPPLVHLTVGSPRGMVSTSVWPQLVATVHGEDAGWLEGARDVGGITSGWLGEASLRVDLRVQVPCTPDLVKIVFSQFWSVWGVNSCVELVRGPHRGLYSTPIPHTNC
jgi:hypothetical protein